MRPDEPTPPADPGDVPGDAASHAAHDGGGGRRRGRRRGGRRRRGGGDHPPEGAAHASEGVPGLPPEADDFDPPPLQDSGGYAPTLLEPGAAAPLEETSE